MSDLWTPPSHHGEIITPDHPAYRDERNGHVWGTLVGHHNPFLHDGMGHNEEFWPWEKQSIHYDHATHGPMLDAMRKHLQGQVDQSQPCIAMHSHPLSRILHEGRIKNQFETRVSSGAWNPLRRKCVEALHWKYPSKAADAYNNGEHLPHGWENDPDLDTGERTEGVEEAHRRAYDKDRDAADEHDGTPGRARPIYGYLAHDPIRNDTTEGYGNHTLVLKKHKVWHRTSVTFGDSLLNETASEASPVQRVSHQSAPAHGYDSFESDPRERLTHRIQGWMGYHPDGHHEYTEAQFHGGVGLHDISHVILRGHADDLHLLKDKLTQRGVPWAHVQGDPTNPRLADESRRTAGVRLATRYLRMVQAAEVGAGPKVVATRGGGVYLLHTGPEQGQVADTVAGTLSKPLPLQSVLARGYWEAPEHPVDSADVLPLVRPSI